MPPDPTEDTAQRLVVCWRYADGHVGRGSPLPPEAAREMMAAYAARYPDRTYWIEDAVPS